MNTISQIFPKTDRISGPEVGDGAKPDVPTTDGENEKKKHRPFYEAVDAHARSRLIMTPMCNLFHFHLSFFFLFLILHM